MTEAPSTLHRRAILLPLEQDCSTDTTITVVRMNRKEIDYDLAEERPVLPNPEIVPESFKEMLHERGYRRLYVLFLFTLAGDLTQLSQPAMDTLVRAETDEVYRGIFGDSGKVAMAYGQSPTEELEPLVRERVNQIRTMVAEHCPDPNQYRFGEVSPDGMPREPEQVNAADELRLYEELSES